MKKNIPNRIKWERGMELKPETFIAADDFHIMNNWLTRKLLTPVAYGLISITEFDIKNTLNKPIIVGDTLTIENIDCAYIDKNGHLVRLADSVQLDLSHLKQGEAYVTVCSNINEENGQLISENPYSYKLASVLDKATPIFPIYKLRSDLGNWKVVDYLPPCYSVGSYSKMLEMALRCKECVREIVSLTKKNENILTYGSIGGLYMDLSAAISDETTANFIAILKKLAFTLRINGLLGDTLLSENQTDDFIWKKYDPYDILETVNMAISIFEASISFLQREEPVVVPQAPEKPKEEITYFVL